MVKKHQAVGQLGDTPYKRIAILVGCLIVAVGVYFAATAAVRAVNGHERKLMAALVATFNQPHVGGSFALAQQSQASVFTASGTYGIKDASNAAVDGVISSTMQGKSVKIPAKFYGSLSDREGFVQISDSGSLVDLMAGAPPEFSSELQAISQKIDNKWLRFTFPEKTSNNCTSALIEKVTKDKDATKQLTKVYMGNQFLTIGKVTRKGEKSEYPVSLNQDALKGFIKDLKASPVFTGIKACTAAYDPLGTESADTNAQQQPAALQQAVSQQDSSSAVKITVENGKITEVVSAASGENQMSSARITFDAKPLSVDRPTGDSVEFDAIQPHIVSIGSMLTKQLEAANRAGAQPR